MYGVRLCIVFYFVKNSTRMNPLFTFNSEAFRPPSPKKFPLASHRIARLPKQSSNGSKDSFVEANINPFLQDMRPQLPRRESLNKEKENRSSGQDKFRKVKNLEEAVKRCGKKCMEGNVDQFLFSFRYSRQLTPHEKNTQTRGKSTDHKRQPEFIGKEQFGSSIQLQSLGAVQRRPRIQSVKMSPRIVIPLSDRKLPKVFKMRQEERLPPIKIEEVQKYLSLELRQVQSVNRNRCLNMPHFHKQLEQLG